jgi:predicted amidohydrolase YtcJ
MHAPNYSLAAVVIAIVGILTEAARAADPPATLILHNGKIATVDRDFSIHEAIAIRGSEIVRVGKSAEVLALRGEDTEVVDLGGKMVLPGLIDSHTHPNSAAMHEFDHPIPDMESIADVTAYVRERAKVLGPGKWIVIRQVFITRLREQRYPTRAELDEAAPENPVLFSTGPDASVNLLALKVSGIDKDFKISGAGQIERDPATGEPTGILRSCTRYVKVESSGKPVGEEDRIRRLLELFADYHSVGITSIADRDADGSALDRYRALNKAGKLSVRVAVSRSLDPGGALVDIQKQLSNMAADPLAVTVAADKRDTRLRIVGVKCYLDGGMLTGSAYMREPWGVSDIYSIRDPNYRGVLMIERERLLPIVRATVESGLQFTAHSVGDGACATLLDVFAEVNKSTPIAKTRPCLTHANFLGRDLVEQMALLGVVADIQPAWLYLDAHTLSAQFGEPRLRYFQPLKSLFAKNVIVGGGSDHMQKIGSLRSVNPYNPFLGMWVAATRQSKLRDKPLHIEEALSRAQSIRFYTANNAYLTFREKEVGSLEPGKLADLIVVDTDLLTCETDKIRDAKVLRTYLDGRLVYRAK